MAGRRRKGAGSVRQLPSGRWQASYLDDDGTRRPAPRTFDTKLDAATWLKALAEGTLAPAEAPGALTPEVPTLAEYWPGFLATRPLRPRTAVLYANLWRHVEGTFGDWRLDELTPAAVRAWHATLDPGRPTQRAHVYSLLRTVMNTALSEGLIAANPCRIRGAGATKASHKIRIASLDELERIVAAMPDRLQAAVLLAAWCGLRKGEVLALTRADVDLKHEVVHVTKGYVRVPGQAIIGRPKTDAGVRDVAIPPHIIPALREHVAKHVARPGSSPFITAARGGPAHDDTLRVAYETARTAAGRPDLHFHDLRHTGATMAAATGATLADLMGRMGHTTPAMAMRYQHAVADRDQQLAAALSKLATPQP